MARKISYTDRRQALKHSRFKRRIKIFLAIFFSLLIILSIGWILFFSPAFLISQIEINGTEANESVFLEQSVYQFLNQRSLMFLPPVFRKNQKSVFIVKNLNDRNLVFFSASKLNEFLLSFYPDLKNTESQLSWQKENGWKLTVKVFKRQPVALWCQKENCFLVDSEGLIYQELKGPVADKFLIFNDLSAQRLAIKSRVIEGSVLERLLTLSSLLAAKEITIKEIEMKNPESQALYLLTAGGWSLILDKNFEPQTINKIITELINQKKITDWKSLKYLDLRYENRIIYQ